MNTKDKGEITEGKVATALISKGCSVLFPFSDNKRYDLVVEVNGYFKTVQCKSGRIKNGAIIFKTSSSYSYKIKRNESKDYSLDVDYFAVYCFDNDKIYIIPISECTKSEMSLRLEDSKNNQRLRTRKAINYELRDGSQVG